MDHFKKAIEKASQWLEDQLQTDGSYKEQNDLACYYKSPYLFNLIGKPDKAHLILDYIKTHFMKPSGDFLMSPEKKSDNGAFVEYWPYINGWIAIAAHRLGRFDISLPEYHYLKKFYNIKLGAYTTRFPFGEGDNQVDVLTAAHLGLCSLYFHDEKIAEKIGDFLSLMIGMQPNLKSCFYLRMNETGQLIREFDSKDSIFYSVSANESNQAYFMVGYPVAFLAKLYQVTGKAKILQTAVKYLEFCIACRHIETFFFSHKVAWGASLIASLTKKESYLAFSRKIADYLVSIQDKNGCWLKEFPSHTYFDQTAENAIWLKEISFAKID